MCDVKLKSLIGQIYDTRYTHIVDHILELLPLDVTYEAVIPTN